MTNRFAKPLHELEREVAHKRSRWLEEHKSLVSGLPPTPRGAYELLFSHYLGVDIHEVPVIEETDKEVRWRSFNRCATLEECATNGLDTRKVCRGVYEKPTQTLISALDPQLRFHRSYTKIRPHEDHCEEWIVAVDFEAAMRLAIEEAKLSRAEGNKGYGAVVLWQGEVLAKAHDTAKTEGDPSLHAEVNALRAACKALGDTNLSGALLVSSCEPCPMCSSLAVWSNVTTIVYGASIEETSQRGKARITVPARHIVAHSPALVEVVGGVLREDCLAL